MHYMITWQFGPEHTKETVQRFLETGGAPPEDVAMLSRWHDLSGGWGCAVFESNDPIALSRWCHQWNDLVTFEIVPVLNDEEIGAVIAP